MRSLAGLLCAVSLATVAGSALGCEVDHVAGQSAPPPVIAQTVIAETVVLGGTVVLPQQPAPADPG